MFGFLAAVVEPEGTVAVAGTFHTLTFKMLTQDGQIFHFTPDGIRAINVSFCKHRALAQCVKEVMEGGALSNSQYLPVSSVFLHGMGSNNPCSKRATPTNSLKCI